MSGADSSCCLCDCGCHGKEANGGLEGGWARRRCWKVYLLMFSVTSLLSGKLSSCPNTAARSNTAVEVANTVESLKVFLNPDSFRSSGDTLQTEATRRDNVIPPSHINQPGRLFIQLDSGLFIMNQIRWFSHSSNRQMCVCVSVK